MIKLFPHSHAMKWLLLYLGAQESRVFLATVCGEPLTAIAKRLKIDPRTASTHKQRAFAKFDFRKDVEATAFCISEGLIGVERGLGAFPEKKRVRKA